MIVTALEMIVTALDLRDTPEGACPTEDSYVSYGRLSHASTVTQGWPVETRSCFGPMSTRFADIAATGHGLPGKWQR